MIWIYCCLGLLEAIIVYIIYDAASFEIVSGHKIYKEYICYGDFVFLSKKEYEKEIKKIQHGIYFFDGEYYIAKDFNRFIDKYKYHVGKFYGAVLIVGAICFLLPFVTDPDDEGRGLGFLIGGCANILLAEWTINNTKKKVDEQIDLFIQLCRTGNTIINFDHLTDCQKNEIKRIALEGYYQYAEKWLTNTEKEIVRKRDYNNSYGVLSRIIENGFELNPIPDYMIEHHPLLGERGNTSQTDLGNDK